MKKNFLFSFIICLLFSSCSESKDGTDVTDDRIEETTYSNPVYSLSMPDPSVIKGRDGYFYVYATEDTRHTPICKSKDLVSWQFVGTAFSEETRPTFEPNGGLWAPDINYINDQYVMYYSMSVWGGGNTCGIGTATAARPEGPFHDNGKLFRSDEIGVHNSIDPFYINDEGKNYVFWGSFFGLYAIELTDDGLNIKYGAEKQFIAGNAFEATYIYKKDGYYYLFASVGTCCDGVNSTYKLVVGRSESLFGPYVDRAGKDMKNNGYEIILDSNDRFVGNGHCSEIITDDKGVEWILYHGIDVENPNGRVLLLDQVNWYDGWPIVGDGSPTLTSELPYFE
ncbi:family 43 glycosylhydrolase [Plebeiibacterium sediminum]|uniref:Family 43 glycosylhydrolase n=1 Tax=Plebeiibacterium sediminum TaxID=2992112 RepID=A0AAE3M3P2_9BACT|nr:family 43 glycosylhydrolase [Plebeiobacterium sediminum]MCW3786279.1 family 43 glycosylhydrolase [Plebeiobacterium sediminum]